MADESSFVNSGRDYIIKQTTRTTRARITALDCLDVNTLHRDKSATALKLNELGRVSIRNPGSAAARRVLPQRSHRIVHPDRPGHQRDRRGRDGPRHRSDRRSGGNSEHRAAPVSGDRR